MNPKNFPVACKSFCIKIIKQYFTLNNINQGFFYALLISNFIFLDFVQNIFLEFISPFIAFYGLYKLISSRKEVFFFTGFFVGILWFYWISFSLIYYDLKFLIPFEILFIAIVYGCIFLICGLNKNLFFRALMLYLISYIHPFGFDWLNLELILVNGIFQPNFRGFLMIMLAIIFLHFDKKMKFVSILFLISALQFSEFKPNFLPFRTKIIQTNIDQNEKWEEKNKIPLIKNSLKSIDEAINEKYKVVILPENAFVTYLNLEDVLIEILKEKSKQITIIAGALAYEKNKIYNSTYVFENNTMQRFDKHFLVPFGEEIPLPEFVKKIINKYFFDGASDFAKSKKIYNDYKIGDILVRNAICYEVTKKEIYQNSPKIIVAITNNAWFMPSTQPIVQKFLIKYYASKYGVSVYHSVNKSKSGIIVPKQMWIKRFLNLIKNKKENL